MHNLSVTELRELTVPQLRKQLATNRKEFDNTRKSLKFERDLIKGVNGGNVHHRAYKTSETIKDHKVELSVLGAQLDTIKSICKQRGIKL